MFNNVQPSYKPLSTNIMICAACAVLILLTSSSPSWPSQNFTIDPYSWSLLPNSTKSSFRKLFSKRPLDWVNRSAAQELQVRGRDSGGKLHSWKRGIIIEQSGLPSTVHPFCLLKVLSGPCWSIKTSRIQLYFLYTVKKIQSFVDWVSDSKWHIPISFSWRHCKLELELVKQGVQMKVYVFSSSQDPHIPKHFNALRILLNAFQWMQQQLRRIFDAAGVSPTGEDAGLAGPLLKLWRWLHIHFTFLLCTFITYSCPTQELSTCTLPCMPTTALWGSGKWGQLWEFSSPWILTQKFQNYLLPSN